MEFQHKWAFNDLVRVIVWTLILFIFMFLATDWLIQTGWLDSVKDSGLLAWVTLGLYLVQTLAIVLPFYILVVRRYRLNWEEIGFKWLSFWKVVKYATVAWFGYLVISGLIVSFFWELGVEEIPGFQKQTPIIPFFGEANWEVMIAFVVVAMIAPVVEEVFFRGFILPTLVGRFKLWAGTILAAAVFALIHLEFQKLIPLFILGLIMNELYLRTRSLWPGIGFHVLNNVVAFGAEWAIMKGWIPELSEMTEGVLAWLPRFF